MAITIEALYPLGAAVFIYLLRQVIDSRGGIRDFFFSQKIGVVSNLSIMILLGWTIATSLALSKYKYQVFWVCMAAMFLLFAFLVLAFRKTMDQYSKRILNSSSKSCSSPNDLPLPYLLLSVVTMLNFGVIAGLAVFFCIEEIQNDGNLLLAAFMLLLPFMVTLVVYKMIYMWRLEFRVYTITTDRGSIQGTVYDYGRYVSLYDGKHIHKIREDSIIALTFKPDISKLDEHKRGK